MKTSFEEAGINTNGDYNTQLHIDHVRNQRNEIDENPFGDDYEEHSDNHQKDVPQQSYTRDENPFIDNSNTNKLSAISRIAPRLNTAFLMPGPYTPSPRSAASNYSRHFSELAIQANEASNRRQNVETYEQESHLRYSDCEVNPLGHLMRPHGKSEIVLIL